MPRRRYQNERALSRWKYFLSAFALLVACSDPPFENLEGEGAGLSDQGGVQTVESGGNQSIAGESINGRLTEAGSSEAGLSIEDPLPRTCVPGERLRLCLICGPGNTYVVPTQDESCDPIDCSAYANYRLAPLEAGGVECRIRRWTAGPSMCEGDGACYQNPEDYCEKGDEEVDVPSSEIGECFDALGCREDEPLELVPAEGRACANDTGVCNSSGECEISSPLVLSCEELVSDWQYNANNRICVRDMPNQGECEFYARSNQNPWTSGEINCDDFCSSNGGRCIDAWDENNDSCNHKNRISCQERFNDAICLCGP